jgi:hypothetical protein
VIVISGGSGPDAIRGRSYAEISAEISELDSKVQRRGAEVPVLPQMPRNPAGVWNAVDRGPPPGNGGKHE